MPFEVTIQEPVVGKKLKVDFSWPTGFKKAAHVEDEEGERYVIIFFDPAPGNPEGDDVIEINIDHHSMGTEHSVTAIGLQGKEVVAQDRKMVRGPRQKA